MYSRKVWLVGLVLASGIWAQTDAWLEEDVVYIATEQEKSAYRSLVSDEAREGFIESFWLRRDPTPDTLRNEFKDEHYRRIAYANERFRAKVAGWRTDRGKTYITLGPPDEIEAHPSGVRRERPPEEGGGITETFPFEKWRYRKLEMEIEFVDRGEGYRQVGTFTKAKTGI